MKIASSLPCFVVAVLVVAPSIAHPVSLSPLRKGDATQGSIRFDQNLVEQRTDSAGVEWTEVYGAGREPSSIKVDAAGNSYVTGESLTYDYATIKYDVDGAVLWARKYNGPANGVDRAVDLQVDATGSVYVTGTSFDIGTSNSGGSPQTDFATVKYDSHGVEKWVVRYDGPDHRNDVATALQVDAEGNVYVTGSSQRADGTSAYLTIMYDSTGKELWTATYDWPESSHAVGLALDEFGNVYVTGNSRRAGSSSADEYATVKYDPAGTVLWTARYAALSKAGANDIAVSPTGNVFVTGWSVELSQQDFTTVKYNADGAEQWVARYNGPESGDDFPVTLALDDAENVYVVGSSLGPSAFEYAVVKYNADGVEQWSRRVPNEGGGNDHVGDLQMDTSGNIYVTGRRNGELFTVKYDATGAEQWTKSVNQPSGNSTAIAMALDSMGNVYITGRTWVVEVNNSGYRYLTVKLSQALVTSIEPRTDTHSISLRSAYPNPSSGKTTIPFELNAPRHVTITIHDMSGRKVATIVDEYRPAGTNQVLWDAAALPSGIYICVFESLGVREVQKIVLTK